MGALLLTKASRFPEEGVSSSFLLRKKRPWDVVAGDGVKAAVHVAATTGLGGLKWRNQAKPPLELKATARSRG